MQGGGGGWASNGYLSETIIAHPCMKEFYSPISREGGWVMVLIDKNMLDLATIRFPQFWGLAAVWNMILYVLRRVTLYSWIKDDKIYALEFPPLQPYFSRGYKHLPIILSSLCIAGRRLPILPNRKEWERGQMEPKPTMVQWAWFYFCATESLLVYKGCISCAKL